MYDGGKIVGGLVLFLVLLTLPIWLTAARGKADYRPNPEIPATEKRCVESRAYMKAWHMDLLNRWRDAVVRTGKEVYVATDGRKFEMSLTLGCMRCHTDKAKFCDRCHNYVGVSPNCWDCHVEPKGK
jgi:hypothetical protein